MSSENRLDPSTEYRFELPVGYVDSSGRVHREGALRRATAGDVIRVLEDPRVGSHRAWAIVLLLARVIVRLGDLEADAVTPEVVEGLYAADLAHLERIYRGLNGDPVSAEGLCPHCGRALGAEGAPPEAD